MGPRANVVKHKGWALSVLESGPYLELQQPGGREPRDIPVQWVRATPSANRHAVVLRALLGPADWTGPWEPLGCAANSSVTHPQEDISLESTVILSWPVSILIRMDKFGVFCI